MNIITETDKKIQKETKELQNRNLELKSLITNCVNYGGELGKNKMLKRFVEWIENPEIFETDEVPEENNNLGEEGEGSEG